MSKHIPGPWIVDTLDGAPLIYCKSQRADIAYVALHSTHPICENSKPTLHHEANARLIAAAPDLLAALELAESVYRQNCVAEGEPSTVLEAMQNAIAKATGETT